MASTPVDNIQAESVFKQAWRLIKPYFLQSESRVKAQALVFSVIALTLFIGNWSFVFSNWVKKQNDALQEKNGAAFYALIPEFFWVVGILIAAIVFSFYLAEVLELGWRKWLTQRLLDQWLAHKNFYRFELDKNIPGSVVPDNPDQRIQEDVEQFTNLTLKLLLGLLSALASLTVFGVMLAGVNDGDDMHLPQFLGGGSFDIPGFMLWVALLYCGLGTVISFFLGKPLKQLNFDVQKLEANFRYQLVRVRENAEAIALDDGERVEHRDLDGKLNALLAQKYELIKKETRLSWFVNFFTNFSLLFPTLVLAPRYFSGSISMGTLMQVGMAFGAVQTSLSWLINNYPQLAKWRATTQRLSNMSVALELASKEQVSEYQRGGNDVQITQLDLALPTGKMILAQASITAEPGSNILISGPSGSGKSTLLRALAGIWPYAGGRVQIPKDAVFIPQRNYFPEGPLRNALAYPEDVNQYTDAQLRAALEQVKLDGLVDRLDDKQTWQTLLSGGEQQRLAVARVLLKRPAWVFADEISSALDNATEEHIYQALTQMVKEEGGAMVSVAHRDSVQAFHDLRWRFDPPSQQVHVEPMKSAQ